MLIEKKKNKQPSIISKSWHKQKLSFNGYCKESFTKQNKISEVSWYHRDQDSIGVFQLRSFWPWHGRFGNSFVWVGGRVRRAGMSYVSCIMDLTNVPRRPRNEGNALCVCKGKTKINLMCDHKAINCICDSQKTCCVCRTYAKTWAILRETTPSVWGSPVLVSLGVLSQEEAGGLEEEVGRKDISLHKKSALHSTP